MFLEYDLYDFGKKRLLTLSNFAPNLIAPPSSDEYAQEINIGTANTLRLGLNVKFMDNGIFDGLNIPAAWMLYIGGFVGQSNVDFQYQSVLITSRPAAANTFHVNRSDSFQQGFAGGGQVGVQYHFQSPYFIGLRCYLVLASLSESGWFLG